MASRDHFKGKRIALIGLGPHGEMVADAKFLIKAGALVSVYDVRSETRLKSHLVFLRSIGLANYVCGSIPVDDLLDMDIVILSHEYPRTSSFLKAVEDKGIPIEYPETLFFKLAPPVTVVGIMGSCGKATTISILKPLLEIVCAANGTQNFFVVDPESDEGILTHIKKIKSGDILLIRVIEPMMRELHALRVSPHVAVFTTLPPRQAYDESPFEILEYQTYNNFIIGSDEVIDAIRIFKFQPKAKMLRTKESLIPPEWQFTGKKHNRDNASLALQVALLFKIDQDAARRSIEAWKPLKGRLELIKKVKNVEFYNDTASVSPDSTICGMISLSAERNLVVILGGAESGFDYRELYAALPTYAHTLIVIPGSGTLRERRSIETLDTVDAHSAPSIEEAVHLALEHAKPGDRVLFSPGFAAVGIDASRKERGERFVRAVRGL